MAKTATVTAPGFNIEALPIADIKPYAKNARRHPPKQVEAIAKSLREYGWTMPLLADKNNELVGGHGRLLAAIYCRDHGWAVKDWPDAATVPVRRMENATPAQIKAYRLADNRLAEMADWDEDMLAQELAALSGEAFNMELTGFAGDDLEAALGGVGKRKGGGRKGVGGGGDPVISYSIIFETADHHKQFTQFLKALRAKYPNEDTIGGRIVAYLKEFPITNG